MIRVYFSLLFIFISFYSFSQDVEIENLGPNINSPYAELNPIISADGKTLYFIRANHPQNLKDTIGGSQDIWFSTLNEKGEWETAQHAGKLLNRERFNTVFNLSTGGNKMLIGGQYVDGINWGPGFSFIQRMGDNWGEPYYLNIKNFDKMCKGEYSSACLLSDNKTLLLCFSETEGSKMNDLYVSFQTHNGKWSQPKSLGVKINTNYDETTPFMAADGVTLYFASDRPGGFGMKDIYMTKRLDDTWENWIEPVNMGKPINTEKSEGYYTIPASGKVAYMVSYYNTLGKTDIVRIKTKDATKPKPVVMVSGKVLNAKNMQPVESDISYEVLTTGAEAGIASFRSKNGDYKIILPYGKNYGISAKAKGFVPVSINIDLTQPGEYTEMKKMLLLVPMETGQIVRMNNIFFDLGKTELKKESYPELDRIIQIMKENPAMNIEIAGHTDDVGDENTNLKLSVERALAVENYIQLKGIKDYRVISTGYGKAKPISDNKSEEGRQQNRRVEFKILMN
ncbi:MAG: OmpA family protein [Bacteroidia bacterium]